jgi:hypothetical protein
MLRRGSTVLTTAVVLSLGAPTVVAAEPVVSQASTISDGRIDEASSLVVSPAHPGIAYTANDEPKPIVFAINIATGAVVGTAKFAKRKGKSKRAKLIDPEALSRDPSGLLWLSDTGDNDERRSSAALYAFPEVGPGRRKVRPVRYPVVYGDGRPHNVETLLINPITGAKFLVSKAAEGTGTVFALPDGLSAGAPNMAPPIASGLPQAIADGSFTPDGQWVVVRDNEQAYVVDPTTWRVVRTLPLPAMTKGEGLSFDPSGAAFLLSGEGVRSPLIWVGFN